MAIQGECPKCGKRMLHVRIESILGQNNGNGDVRCLSYSCIHCNAVLFVQPDPRGRGPDRVGERPA
jgi:DNA-directed RNA polymerase subunit RPC12/RpoP